MKPTTKEYITYFLLYGFLGWAIDTGFRSLLVMKYAAGTGIPFFSVVYASGALVVLWLQDHVHPRPIPIQFIVYALACTVVEYLGAYVGFFVTGRELWNYNNAYAFHGVIDLFHTLSWGVLAFLLIHYIHPFLKRLLRS